MQTLNETIKLAGDSIWTDTNNMSVNVTGINTFKPEWDEADSTYRMVYVEHNGPWDIYTDSGFEKAISKIVGFKVMFTEQGMQENGIASLEGEAA